MFQFPVIKWSCKPRDPAPQIGPKNLIRIPPLEAATWKQFKTRYGMVQDHHNSNDFFFFFDRHHNSNEFPKNII